MTGGRVSALQLLWGRLLRHHLPEEIRIISGTRLRLQSILLYVMVLLFLARVAVDTVPHINDAKKAIKKAFQVQLDGLGFGFVESIVFVSYTNWHLSPEDAHKRIREEMMPVFPLGIFKDTSEESK